MAALDVRRLGEYATKEYAVRRLSTGHAFEAPVYFPHAEHLAARPVWTTPLFSTLREKGAVFGAKDGWEVPNWFAPKGIEPVDRPTYRRANWFDHVGDEYRAVSEAVGVIDSSCLAKFDVSGPGAESFLDRMVANIMPIAGGLRVCPVLNEAGHVIALWLVGKYQENGFYVTAASNCTGRDYDLLRWNAPSDVSVTDISNRTGVLTVAGPYGSQLLKNLGLESRIPMCFGVSQLWIEWIPVRILRLNWGKVPVWEIHTAMEYLVGLYDMVLGAGKNLGVVDFGMRAMQSMRLESGLPAIGIDIQPRCSPKRSLLKRYVALSKRAFVGRDALDVEEAAQGRRLSRLAVDPLESSDHHPWGDEPILIDDRDVGVVTSAFFGYGAGCPVGFGYIDCDVSISDKLSIQVLGKKVSIELFDDGLDMPGVIAS
jgi:dimethylglycine dehydrogenase